MCAERSSLSKCGKKAEGFARCANTAKVQPSENGWMDEHRCRSLRFATG